MALPAILGSDGSEPSHSAETTDPHILGCRVEREVLCPPPTSGAQTSVVLGIVEAYPSASVPAA